MESIGVFGRTVVAAVVGGVTAEAMGGKFANGAVTGAFSRLFNDELHSYARSSDAIRNVGMALGEALRGGDVLATIRFYGSDIETQSFLFGVDADLVRAIIYEEQTHLSLFEADLEAAGFGSTVGLGQLTVGYFGYSRDQLLNPETNIRAIANQLFVVSNEPLISSHAPVASIGTRYNCDVCQNVSSYGRRVDYYYNQFSSGVFKTR